MTATGSELCDLPLLFKNGNICAVILNYSEFLFRNNGQNQVQDCSLLLQHQEISLFIPDVSAGHVEVKLILMTLYSAGICCDPHVFILNAQHVLPLSIDQTEEDV